MLVCAFFLPTHTFLSLEWWPFQKLAFLCTAGDFTATKSPPVKSAFLRFLPKAPQTYRLNLQPFLSLRSTANHDIRFTSLAHHYECLLILSQLTCSPEPFWTSGFQKSFVTFQNMIHSTYERKTWKSGIFKRREACNTYLTHNCRHHYSGENLVKILNIEPSANTVAFISCRHRQPKC